MGHVGLDVADAGGGGVFLGFDVVVEEVGGAGELLARRIHSRRGAFVQRIFGARHVGCVGQIKP